MTFFLLSQMDHPPISSLRLWRGCNSILNSLRQKVQGCRLHEAVFFNCKNHESSPYTRFVLPPVMFNNYDAKNFFNFRYQPQEESGSAGEQPASNRADGYTMWGGMIFRPTFLVYRYPAWLKKLIRNFFMLLFLFDKALHL
jgi:hypothetical protein